jgi:putative DNA primase/helicase
MKGALDFDAINQAALAAFPAVLNRLLPGSKTIGREIVALNPRRADLNIGSFKVNRYNGRWCDFATGDKGGDPVSLCAYLEGISQPEAARLLSRMLSIDNGDSSRLGSLPLVPLPRRPGPFELRPGEFCRDQREAARLRLVCEIWNASKPAKGTRAEEYLKARGLELPDCENVRFHPALKHIDGRHWPAMVCLVERSTGEAPLAIHRTFLSHDGVASKAPVSPSKMMLGPCRGGAVRLGMLRAGERLAVAEGIETALAVAAACALPAWAALSAGGIRALVLPREATHVVICADHDASGTGWRAATDAAQRWLGEGRRVRIAMPPELGTDMADALIADTVEARHVA